MLTKLRSKFTYTDKPEGEAIEIDVWYEKGGRNYFSSSSDRRGIYVSFRTVTLKNEGAYMSKSFMLFTGGIKFFALALKRKSDKQLQCVADLLSPYVVELAQTYRRDPEEASRA